MLSRRGHASAREGQRDEGVYKAFGGSAARMCFSCDELAQIYWNNVFKQQLSDFSLPSFESAFSLWEMEALADRAAASEFSVLVECISVGVCYIPFSSECE